MEPLPQEVSRRAGAVHFLLIPAALVSLTGCIHMGSLLKGGDGPPAPTVCQAMATWNRQVLWVPNPANGGTPEPGIAGRLYLFGQTIDYPLIGDGSLIIDLYDDSAKAQGGDSVMIEEWRVDRDTLRRLLRKDTIGHGYTLFLPMHKYRPDLTQVHVHLRYDPVQGTPIFAPSATMTLDHDTNKAPHLISRNHGTSNVRQIQVQPPRAEYK